jgi:hypothetical protein
MSLMRFGARLGVTGATVPRKRVRCNKSVSIPPLQRPADTAPVWIVASLDESWTIPTESSSAATYSRTIGIAGMGSRP